MNQPQRAAAFQHVSEHLQLGQMDADDLPEVLKIENQVYPFPWTHGNFLDSIHSGYECHTLRDGSGRLLGYFLVMLAVDEAHLLNITIHPELHGQGLGCFLLDKVNELARLKQMTSVILEVRPSNPRAQAVYEKYGFTRIGLRKGYYPAADQGREDAIVMRFTL